jgi:hypothetical protein
MSNPDSFIDEVTEEVRRDRLFALMRKYGWIAILAVVLIVGAASWYEYSKAQHDARAQVFGAGLAAALDQTGPARADAVAGLSATDTQAAIKDLFLADGLDKTSTVAALDNLANDATQPQIYRDLAVLRRVMLADLPLADRRTALEGISGRSLGILAREQLAYLLIEEGKKDEAIAALIALVQEQAAPGGLVARARQAITSLGGKIPETNAG